MSERSPTKLQLELVGLMEQQVDSLERQTFGAETEDEVQQYFVRQDRIRDLLNELYLPDRAA